MDWIKLYYQRKHSCRYDFKIVLKRIQDSPDIALVQWFKLFLKKMVAADPHFMIQPWKENSEENQLQCPTRSQTWLMI